MEHINAKANNFGTFWWLSVFAAGIGLVDSIYLTWIKLANSVISCSGIGDCEAVNSSRYSEVSGIPIALFGVGAFLLIIALLLFETRFQEQAQNLHLGVFGISLAGTLYSAYLTYIEVAVLEAICPFCVVSAVMLTGLFVVSVMRIKADFEYD